MTAKIVSPGDLPVFDREVFLEAVGTEPMERTPEQWYMMARECFMAQGRSERDSDTDGFLSQRANQQAGHRYMRLAERAAEGWECQVPAVFDLEGNLVTVENGENDYGFYWYIPQNEGKARYFRESQANNLQTRRTNNAGKGYQRGIVTVGMEYDARDAAAVPNLEDVREVVTKDQIGDLLADGLTTWEQFVDEFHAGQRTH